MTGVREEFQFSFSLSYRSSASIIDREATTRASCFSRVLSIIHGFLEGGEMYLRPSGFFFLLDVVADWRVMHIHYQLY